ncbi:MAG: AsmA family protein, partial [Pseudomonadota bacterium]
MKRFFVALVGLVVLVAAAAVVAPGFINWNDHRDRVSALLASQFGRDVDIAGALDLTLLPTPILSADDVRVGGDGENAPLTLSAIEVALAPVSLLSGELRVLRAIMVDPKVQVTRQPDGSLQWPVGVATEGPIPARLATLDRVTLSNGTIVIDDPDAGQVTEITDIFAQFSGDLTTGETSLTGSFQAAGVPLAIDLQSREQASNGSLPVTLSLGIDGLDNELRYAGL